MALNGSMRFEYNNSIPFLIDCKYQEEADPLWNSIHKDGGKEQQYGWINDKYNVQWQIIPTNLLRMMVGADLRKAQHALEAMMTMVKIDIALLHKAYIGE